MKTYKIYKLTGENDKFYFGKTTQDLPRRLASHKSHKKRNRKITSNLLDNPTIELMEECDESNVTERERYYIENFDCVNKQRPGVNAEEIKKQKTQLNLLRKEKPRIKCECGCEIAFYEKSRHVKSKKHKKYLDNILNDFKEDEKH